MKGKTLEALSFLVPYVIITVYFSIFNSNLWLLFLGVVIYELVYSVEYEGNINLQRFNNKERTMYLLLEISKVYITIYIALFSGIISLNIILILIEIIQFGIINSSKNYILIFSINIVCVLFGIYFMNYLNKIKITKINFKIDIKNMIKEMILNMLESIIFVMIVFFMIQRIDL